MAMDTGKMELRDSLIEYPCDFPIKVFGRSQEGFTKVMIDVVTRHDPGFKPASIQIRNSSKARYVSITFTIHATSREQLDALYRELCGHPLVAMVL
jgi:putative lipoic acid-binding regulatory protein